MHNHFAPLEMHQQLILDTMQEMLASYDTELRIQWANKAAAASVGQTAEALTGRYCYEIWQDRQAPCEDCPVITAMQTSRPQELEKATPQGRIFHIRGYPVHDAQGALIGAVEYGFDITEARQAQQSLNESEERFRQLVESAPMSILLLRNGRYVYGNPASAALLGYESPEEIQGMEVLQTIAPEFHDIVKERMDNINTGRGNEPMELQLVKPNGDRVWTRSTSVAVIMGGEPTAIIVGQDSTEQRKAEAERLRLISAIEQAAEIFVITDTNGSIQYVNPAFERVTGYQRDEALGRNPRILKSGEQDEAFYKQLWQTICSGRTWQGRMTNKKKDGSLYVEEATISPVLDADGNIVNYIAVKRDITEERQTEERLRQAQKMEAIGTLAGGIAHDFNNILYPLMGYTEMLKSDVPEDSPLQNHIDEILQASLRARDLVKQILSFSRQGEQELKPITLQPVIKEALKLLRSSIPTTIDIQDTIHPDCGPVLADPIQIHQIVMNLATNAYHAMEDSGGTLQVDLQEVRLASGQAPLPALPTGSYARLGVADTGIGIEKNALGKIFDPYYTTKKRGKGTGLGLSVVQGIIQSCSGDILVQSEPGAGTCVQVFLPVIEHEAETTSFEAQQGLQGGTESILLIDDETTIVKLLELMLQRLGYTLTTRSGSLEALETFKADPDAFDLVITDMTMPHMTGLQLAEALKAIRPDIPVILCTGFSEQINEEKSREFGIEGFVMKPIIKKDIAAVIRKVLGAAQAE
ncbi:MAG: PAS domain S-box protein [Desulfohalobiaceae bacterium]|nr:PAS domain S-box protein [Desulfohalobiaceae bacterium]